MKILIFLLCCFVAGCTTYKYLGKEQTQLEQMVFAVYSCPVETNKCLIKEDFEGSKLNGSYFLNNEGDGAYTISGSVVLDISENGIVFDRIERLDLLFIFFKDKLVVHEEKVRLRGKVNEHIKFSQLIKSGEIFDSSVMAEASYLASELLAF